MGEASLGLGASRDVDYDYTVLSPGKSASKLLSGSWFDYILVSITCNNPSSNSEDHLGTTDPLF